MMKQDKDRWFILIGILITAFASVYNSYVGRSTHALVNSQYSQSKAETREAREEIAALRKEIAILTGTVEDRVRSNMAFESLQKPAPLPKEGK